MPRTATAPTRPDPRRVATACCAVAACALAFVAARGGAADAPRTAAAFSQARGLPSIVFVSRRAPAGPDSAQVPGMGPRGRALAPGGRLLVRAPDGAVRELVPAARFHDVADPAVSFDASTLAFAAVERPGAAWRLWTVRADGTGLAPLTRDDRVLDLAPLGPGAARRFARYDDLDPAWLPDGRVVFASTRFPQRAQQGGGDVTNLFTVHAGGGGLERITSERNGGEEPAFDPATGRIVYTRWLFSPWRPSDGAPGGLVLGAVGAVERPDTVDLWQVLSVLVNGDRAQLAAGDPRERAATMAYAPVVPQARPSKSVPAGTVFAVQPGASALVPDPGPTRLVAFPGGIAAPVALAGPGLAGAGPRARAVAPTALPDGRVLFAFDRDDGGDFGLWTLRPDGSRLERVLDLPGTLELDPVALVARPVVPIPLDEGGGVEDLAPLLPATALEQLTRREDTFRFDCLNVYATGPVDSPFPDAPRIGAGVPHPLLRHAGATGGGDGRYRGAGARGGDRTLRRGARARRSGGRAAVRAAGRRVGARAALAAWPGARAGRELLARRIGHQVHRLPRRAFCTARAAEQPRGEVVQRRALGAGRGRVHGRRGARRRGPGRSPGARANPADGLDRGAGPAARRGRARGRRTCGGAAGMAGPD